MFGRCPELAVRTAPIVPRRPSGGCPPQPWGRRERPGRHRGFRGSRPELEALDRERIGVHHRGRKPDVALRRWLIGLIRTPAVAGPQWHGAAWLSGIPSPFPTAASRHGRTWGCGAGQAKVLRSIGAWPAATRSGLGGGADIRSLRSGPVGNPAAELHFLHLGDRLRMDSEAAGQGPQAPLTTVYRSTDRRCRGGAAVENLAQSAPFRMENTAPSHAGAEWILSASRPPRTPAPWSAGCRRGWRGRRRWCGIARR